MKNLTARTKKNNMKKYLPILGFSLLIVTAVAVTAAGTQQDKNPKKDKQEQPGKQKDKQDKGKPDDQVKGNQGKNDDKGNQGKNDEKGNQGKNDNKGNQGNKDDKDDKDNQGKGNNDKNDGVVDDRGNFMKKGFKWDRETFKEREKFRKGEKVTVCHKFNREDEPAVTINISANALQAHLGHGDVRGECPAVENDRWSDRFLRQRSDYYNNVVATNEQVVYSQSILDYALNRLTGARTQLVTLQNSNAPAADIERKRLLVVELEENTSLLQNLIGVTASLVANKLAD